MLALIHVFLDNARYHHAKLVQDWPSFVARPEFARTGIEPCGLCRFTWQHR
jgi:hypothetical protein